MRRHSRAPLPIPGTIPRAFGTPSKRDGSTATTARLAARERLERERLERASTTRTPRAVRERAISPRVAHLWALAGRSRPGRARVCVVMRRCMTVKETDILPIEAEQRAKLKWGCYNKDKMGSLVK